MTRSPKIKLSGSSKLPPALPEIAQLQHFRQRIVAALAMRPAGPALAPIADAVLAAAHDDQVLEMEAHADQASAPIATTVGDAQAAPDPANLQEPAGELERQLQDPASQAAELALLRRLAAARYGAYRSENGYVIGGGGGPEIREETVEHLVAGGWAFREPSGGRLGSVKISPEGRARLGVTARASRGGA